MPEQRQNNTIYTPLMEENKNNIKFLFSTGASLTMSHSTVEQCIPCLLSSNDFLNFFPENISQREKEIN